MRERLILMKFIGFLINKIPFFKNHRRKKRIALFAKREKLRIINRYMKRASIEIDAELVECLMEERWRLLHE
jgi:hypothetical protein